MNILHKGKASSERLEKFLNYLEQIGVESSLSVHNMYDEEEVFSHYSQKVLIPASIVKIVTAYVFLKKLGADYRFKTEVWGGKNWEEIAQDQGVLKGDLWIKGYGDPAFVSESMWNLVEDLYLNGLRQIDGNIYVDNSFLESDVENPDAEKMDEPDTDRPFDAATSASAFNWNSVCFFIKAAREGKPANIILDPFNELFVIKNETVSLARIQKPIKVKRENLNNGELFSFEGEVKMGIQAKRLYKNVSHYSTYIGFGLKHFLKEKKIEMRGNVLENTVPSSLNQNNLLGTYLSKPLNSILGDMNKNSLNFVASLLLKVLGAHFKGVPGNLQKGSLVLNEEIKNFVNNDPIIIESGSGLNRNNKINSIFFNKVLLEILNRFPYGLELMNSLPLAEVDGTLKSRFKGKPYFIRAKTGTLTGVSSLSGFLFPTNLSSKKNTGKIFTIILNSKNGGEILNKTEIVEKILDEIYQFSD